MAAQRTGLRVQGLAGTVANLRAFDAECGRNIRAAVKRSGADMREAAKSLVPIDTGLLYSSIEDTYTPSGLAMTLGCNPEAFSQAGEPDYSRYVEFGTENSPAQPFLFPAFEAIRPHFEQDVRDALRSSIARAGR